MEEKTITLSIPLNVYERVQERAKATNRSPEGIAADSLSLLYGGAVDVPVEELLTQLATYSDAELWVLVYTHLTAAQQERLAALDNWRHDRPLTPEETAEHAALMQVIERQMRLRARALRLLAERGQDIGQYAGVQV